MGLFFVTKANYKGEINMTNTTFLFHAFKEIGFVRLRLPGGKLSKDQARYDAMGLSIMFVAGKDTFLTEVIGDDGYYEKYIRTYEEAQEVFDDIEYLVELRADSILYGRVEESDWY